MLNITRAEALTRIYPHFVRLVLPQGAVDLENDNPSADVNVIATTNALLVREDSPGDYWPSGGNLQRCCP
jgi:uncharacterized protein